MIRIILLLVLPYIATSQDKFPSPNNKADEPKAVVIGTVLDINKAFDCLNHKILARKLLMNFVLHSYASNLIKYLSSREQAMKVNGCVSECCQVVTGVPQRSVLGPLLFIMFIII